MPAILIVEKNGNIKETTVKTYVESDLYKKAGFKTNDGFQMHTSWSAEIDEKLYTVQLFGKTTGKSNQENKYEFPPPVDSVLFFGSCILVNVVNNIVSDLSSREWAKIYEFLYGGFDDIGSDDSSEDESDEEEDDKPRTKAGYVKDGFVVDDDVSESVETEEEEEDADDESVESEESDESEEEEDDEEEEDEDEEEDDDDDDGDDDEGVSKPKSKKKKPVAKSKGKAKSKPTAKLAVKAIVKEKAVAKVAVKKEKKAKVTKPPLANTIVENTYLDCTSELDFEEYVDGN